MNKGLQFIQEWNVKHTSTPNYDDVINWTLAKICDWLKTNIYDFTYVDINEWGTTDVFVDTLSLCNNLNKQF